MSIVTNPKLSAFYRWLHTRPLPEDPARRYTQGRLAHDAMTNRAHLSQVLAGTRSGSQTWRRLVRVLPRDGLFLLRQCSSWNNFAEKAYAASLEAEKPVGAR
jgi:hypothetical protein